MGKKKCILIEIIAMCFLGTSLFFLNKKTEISEAKRIKIACVGDSITFGAYLGSRKVSCYPSRLQELLGDRYKVKNFGVNGSTVQASGDKPYRKEGKYQDSMEYEPDIVLLMLGTNDTKPGNWKGISYFMKDYEELVSSYKGLPSEPKVYLLTPSATGSHKKITRPYVIEPVCLEEEQKAIREYGESDSLEIIDVHALTKEHPEWYWLDGVHPDEAGAAAIAEYIYHVIR